MIGKYPNPAKAGFRYNYNPNRWAKPKNARDIIPAVINIMGAPFKISGIGAISILSLIPAKRIIESV